MNNKLLIHQVFLFGVLLLVTGYRLLLGQWSIGPYLIWWWLGAILGFLFVFMDRVIFVIFQDPSGVAAIRLKELFGMRKYREALASLFMETRVEARSVVRSVLFLGVYLAVAILAATSSSAPLGRGLVLGLGLHLSFDFVFDYLKDRSSFRTWFWQIKREMSEDEKKYVLFGFLIIFVLVALGL